MNSSMQIPNSQKTTESFFLNPVVRRIKRINETDGTAATYMGVFKKTLYFLLTVLAGAVIAFIVHMIPFSGITDDNGIFVSNPEIGMMLVSLVLMVVCPFLAIFLKKTTPVTGALSCIGNGCVLATIGIFLPEYRGAMLLAFVLTFALVGVMLFIYFSGKVNITKKFRVAVFTLFGTMVLGSVLLGLCYFIPGCRDIYNFVQNNVLLSVLCSLGGIAIASLFLFMDFETVRQIVDNKLPQKYEWMAAYSIAFTVIWLYFKILDLFMAAQRNRNR